MGNHFGWSSRHVSVHSSVGTASSPRLYAGRKRFAEEVHNLDVTPMKKRSRSTSDYIYETLFCQGKDSDIVIKALGREWKLHKLYLKQSGYFTSMFSGNWRESHDSRIEIDIPDLNITTEALDVAFSSLYHDEVPLEEVHMCSTLAAASMLQLDGLLEQCKQHMKGSISSDSVVGYFSAASIYGLSDVEDECREWLQLHLMKCYTTSLLKDMPCQLLTDILGSPDLYVMLIEMDVYTLAKKWLFLTLNSDWTGSSEKLLGDAEDYFKYKGEDGSYFLDTEDGKEYVELFKSIRLKHILNDQPSVTTIEEDSIIPQDWLLKQYRQQWLKMLSVDQRLDSGPVGLSQEQFCKHSVRCGRVITESGEYCWRWTGFSFGFDILLMYDTTIGVISLKRNTSSQVCISSVSHIPRKIIRVRLRVTSFHEDKTVHSSLNSGIVQLNLGKDEDHVLLKNVPTSLFPLYIGINLLLTSIDTF